MTDRLEARKSEDLVQGLVGLGSVRNVTTKMGEAIQLVYHDGPWAIDSHFRFQDKEVKLKIASGGRTWSFESDDDQLLLSRTPSPRWRAATIPGLDGYLTRQALSSAHSDSYHYSGVVAPNKTKAPCMRQILVALGPWPGQRWLKRHDLQQLYVPLLLVERLRLLIAKGRSTGRLPRVSVRALRRQLRSVERRRVQMQTGSDESVWR